MREPSRDKTHKHATEHKINKKGLNLLNVPSLSHSLQTSFLLVIMECRLISVYLV